MKRYIKTLLTVLVPLIGATACTDQDYEELNKGNEPLVLTSSGSEVVLEESSHASEAIALNWTTGENYGTGNRISYTLQLAEAGTNFSNPVTVIDNATQVYSWNPSMEQLNGVLLDNMGAKAYSAIELQARVTAHVAGMEDADQISEVTFRATPYTPVTSELYLIGDATPNGWSADNATAMGRLDNGVFSWTGKMNVGEFKFITTPGSFLPSYNKAGEGRLVLRTSDDQPDEKFNITEEHFYKIDVNLLTLTVSVTPVDGETPLFSELYFVGNETDWNFRKMSVDPLDPYLFRIGVFFTKGGEFKFGTAEGSWENMYKAAVANAPYTDTRMEFIKGFDPDNKWLLTDSETNRAYKICVDIRQNRERMLMTLFTPYSEMYLVGDATPGGWDLGAATPMQQDASDPNVFTWTGHLNTGEMKFSADRQSDWNGAWFMASTENEAPTGGVQKVIFIDKSSDDCRKQYLDIAVGDVDRKWVIGEAGTYTITLNQLDEEVTIVKK